MGCESVSVSVGHVKIQVGMQLSHLAHYHIDIIVQLDDNADSYLKNLALAYFCGDLKKEGL